MGAILKPKPRRFVEEYLVDLNATKAAIRAGYSARTAKAQGSRLLTNANVQAALAEGQELRAKRTEVEADRVLREILRILFADIRKAVKWSNVQRPRETGRSDAPVTGDDSVTVLDNGVLLVPSEDLDDETAAAIAEVSQTKGGGLKIKFHDKVAAGTLAMRHLGMLKDRVEHSGSVNVTVLRLSEAQST